MRLNRSRSSRGTSLALTFGVSGLVFLLLAGYSSPGFAADEAPSPQALSDFEAALASWDTGDLEQAIGFCSAALTARPDWPLAHAIRGLMRSDWDDVAAAIADAQKVAEPKPKDADSFLAGGIAGYILALRGEGKREDYLLAHKYLTRAIGMQRKNALGYAIRGRVRAALEQKREALADCDKAIKLSPTSMNYRYRAFVRIVFQDYDGALQDRSKAIELNPIGCNYLIRGMLKGSPQLDDPDGALQDYTKAIELLDPNDHSFTLADAYFERGVLREKQGDLDESRDDWGRALALNPGLAVLHDELAVWRRQLVEERRQLVESGLAETRTFVVAEDGSGDFTSVAKAVFAASWGDTVAVRPGTYVGSVTISTENVGLTGLGPDPAAVVIEGRIYFQNTKQGKLENLTVAGVGVANSEGVTLENLRVVGTLHESIGVMIQIGSQSVVMRNSVVSGLDRGVAIIGGSRAKLERNLVADNVWGVTIQGDSKASLEGNTIVSNQRDGVSVIQGDEEATEVQLYNNITAYNDTGISFTNVAREISYNNSYGNKTHNYDSFVAGTGYVNIPIASEAITGGSNLSVDPLFVDRFAGDYRLRADSPIINRGSGGTYMGAFPPVG